MSHLRSWNRLINALFTLHGTGTGGGTRKRTNAIGNNGSWSLSLSRNSVNSCVQQLIVNWFQSHSESSSQSRAVLNIPLLINHKKREKCTKSQMTSTVQTETDKTLYFLVIMFFVGYFILHNVLGQTQSNHFAYFPTSSDWHMKKSKVIDQNYSLNLIIDFF